jgi:spore photoproduct lyase
MISKKALEFKPYNIKYIFIDHHAVEDEVTQLILQWSNNHSIPIRIVTSSDYFLHYLSQLTISEGKRTLWLTRYKGRFLKPCPGTKDTYRCCQYLVINEITNCPIDCTYCILQGFFNNHSITIYTNYAKILSEIQALSKLNPQRILRIGTGELTDSLALDPLTGLSQKLIPVFQSQTNVLLELKTKTHHIEHLVAPNSAKVVLSWSINPKEIIESHEYKSAKLQSRLNSAKRAIKKGFLVGFHLDPIIHYRDWQNGYRNLIENLGKEIDSTRISWISLGSLRYPSPLKSIAKNRFPRSRIFSAELITGIDNKMRYIKPLRLQMYQFIFNQIRQNLKNVFVYFCMESEDVWEEVLGLSPRYSWEVDFLFAKHLYHKFGELKLPRPSKEIYQCPIIFQNHES